MDGVFDKIKSDLSMKEVAGYYGLDFDRAGMACCPFHDDRTPSLKLYEDHFYCFGCGEHGDVIDLVSELYGLKPVDAARKISEDFGLNLFEQGIAVPFNREQTENQKYRLWLKYAAETVSDYIDRLKEWRAVYSPHDHFTEPNELFIESLNQMSYAEYIRDIIKYGTEDERKDLYLNGKELIDNMRKRTDLAKKTPLPAHSSV